MMNNEQQHGMLANAALACDFMFGGHAYVTLVSKVSGARYTYRITQPEDKKDQFFYFVGLLSGQDNTSAYQYIGVIDDHGFRTTSKSRLTMASVPCKAIKYAVDNIRACNLPDALEIWHDGRCGRCGRKLTVPESVATGLGPECSSKLGVDRKVEKPRGRRRTMAPSVRQAIYEAQLLGGKTVNEFLAMTVTHLSEPFRADLMKPGFTFPAHISDALHVICGAAAGV